MAVYESGERASHLAQEERRLACDPPPPPPPPPHNCWVVDLLQVLRGMSAGARVFEFMTLPSEVSVCEKEQLACSMLSGRIEFQDVSFR